MTTIFVGLTAAIFLAVGFWAGTQSTNIAPPIDLATGNVPPVPELPLTSTATSTTATDKTADWKTYTNDEYGFSFKYPADWTKREGSNGVQVNSPENEQVRKDVEASELEYSDGYTDDVIVSFKTFNEYIEGIGQDVNSLDELIPQEEEINQISNPEKTTWGGREAWGYTAAGMGAYYEIVTNNNGSVISLYFGNRESKDELTNSDNQILSTFEFTK